MTLLLTHTACLDHVTPPGHPERPDRLRAVAEALGEEHFKPLTRSEAPEGNLDSVTLCHGEHYVGELRHIAPQSGMIYIDGDTSMSPGTWEAVMRGVGGAVAATDAVMSGAHANAFVAVRPPGHHAEVSKPMGISFETIRINEADADSSSFIAKKIPAVTLSGLSNEWQSILHTTFDVIKKVKPESVYLGYRLALTMWCRIDEAPCESFR